MGALIGGGIVDLFPRIRAAVIETAGGWLPAALDRFDTHYLMSPGHVPNFKRMPRDVIAEGRYFHGIDSWERSIEFCVEELGEDMHEARRRPTRAQPSLPAFCEAGRPVLRRTSGLGHYPYAPPERRATVGRASLPVPQ